MKKATNIIIVILIILGVVYYLLSINKPKNNFSNHISQSIDQNITKDSTTSEIVNSTSSALNSTSTKVGSSTIPTTKREPDLYACVGEYCDGSMYGEKDKYTAIKLPYIKDGGDIGCGVQIFYGYDAVPKSPALLDAVYKRLFNIKEWPEVKSGGFHNTIAAFDYLYYDHDTLIDGVARVYLLGKVNSPGVCADPELKAQIEAAAFQFPMVNKIEVYLNGDLFDWCLLDLSGGASGCSSNPKYWITSK